MIDWTFPLAYLDVVSGDGTEVYHHRINLDDTKAFGSKEFKLDVALDGRSWIRLEVWDIAGNGTFTQPIWIQKQ